MIEIVDINFPLAWEHPEVFFRYKGIDMCADLDPGVIEPVVIRGSAQGVDVSVDFHDYSDLQHEIKLFVGY